MPPRRTLPLVRVHVAGTLEPRRDGPIDAFGTATSTTKAGGLVEIELAGPDPPELTHEIRCLRCDEVIPGLDWKLGECVVEIGDDDAVLYRPASKSEARDTPDCG